MDDEPTLYRNGSIWRADWPFCYTALLQVLPGARFCLLAYTLFAREGGTCLNVITDPDGSGKWQYSLGELEERLRNWSRLPDEVIELREQW